MAQRNGNGILGTIGRHVARAFGLATPTTVEPAEATGDLVKQRVWGGRYAVGTGNLSAETDEIRRRYREMWRDPTVKSCTLQKIWGTASLDFTVLPADGENPRDVEVAEFHEHMLRNVRGGPRGVVESLLLGALMDGYGVAHKKAAREDRGKWAGKIVLTDLRPKDADFYDLEFDDYRNVTALQERYGDGKKFDPADFVIVRHLQIFESPWGMSDWRAADRAYCCLDATIKLRMIYLDKQKGPFLKGTYGDDTVRNTMAEQLRKARACGYIYLPAGSDVEVLDLATGTDEAYARGVADFREEIATGITGGFLQMMSGQTPGGRGSSTVHNATADLFRWYLAQLVCDALNDQVIPEFTDLNFTGSPAYPKAQLSGVDNEWVKREVEIDEKLAAMGVPMSLAGIYQRTGRSPPKDEADTLAKPQPAAPAPGMDGAADPTANDPDAGRFGVETADEFEVVAEAE